MALLAEEQYFGVEATALSFHSAWVICALEFPRFAGKPSWTHALAATCATCTTVWHFVRLEVQTQEHVGCVKICERLTVQGLLMTAYLKWRGMLETTLSLYRAAGALAGIGATLCFPGLHARLGMLLPHRGPSCADADAETLST